MKNKKRNPVDVTMMSAICLSAMLYLAQYFQWINVKKWFFLIPVVVIAGIWILILGISYIVYLIVRKSNENKT